jgi:hypothetical protein
LERVYVRRINQAQHFRWAQQLRFPVPYFETDSGGDDMKLRFSKTSMLMFALVVLLGSFTVACGDREDESTTASTTTDTGFGTDTGMTSTDTTGTSGTDTMGTYSTSGTSSTTTY